MALDISATSAVTMRTRLCPFALPPSLLRTRNGSNRRIDDDAVDALEQSTHRLNLQSRRCHRVFLRKGTCYTASAQVNARMRSQPALRRPNEGTASKCMLVSRATRIDKPALGTAPQQVAQHAVG
jgi:hypothetical protein